VVEASSLQEMRGRLWERLEGWPVGRLRTLAQDILHSSYQWIPAVSFLMGSPEDEEGRRPHELQHPVEITRPFLLKTTPVTHGGRVAGGEG
jgi:hypothetical protein